MAIILTLVLATWLSMCGVLACVIQGHDVGVCVPEGSVQDEAPFCANLLRYTACVPKQQLGFLENSMSMKDTYVRDNFRMMVDQRSGIEKGVLSFQDPGA